MAGRIGATHDVFGVLEDVHRAPDTGAFFALNQPLLATIGPGLFLQTDRAVADRLLQEVHLLVEHPGVVHHLGALERVHQLGDFLQRGKAVHQARGQTHAQTFFLDGLSERLLVGDHFACDVAGLRQLVVGVLGSLGPVQGGGLRRFACLLTGALDHIGAGVGHDLLHGFVGHVVQTEGFTEPALDGVVDCTQPAFALSVRVGLGHVGQHFFDGHFAAERGHAGHLGVSLLAHSFVACVHVVHHLGVVTAQHLAQAKVASNLVRHGGDHVLSVVQRVSNKVDGFGVRIVDTRDVAGHAVGNGLRFDLLGQSVEVCSRHDGRHILPVASDAVDQTAQRLHGDALTTFADTVHITGLGQLALNSGGFFLGLALLGRRHLAQAIGFGLGSAGFFAHALGLDVGGLHLRSGDSFARRCGLTGF